MFNGKLSAKSQIPVIRGVLFITLSYSLIIGCGEDDPDADPQNHISGGSIMGVISPASANAEVRLLRNGHEIAVTRTNLAAEYAFTNLEAGVYELIITADRFEPLVPDVVSVVPSQIITKDFTLQRLGTKLMGIVVGPNGLWIEHATVTVKSGQGERAQETDQFGTFVFDDIWEGIPMTLTVHAEGAAEKTVVVAPISASETKQLRLNVVAILDE